MRFLEILIVKEFCRNFVLILTFSFYEYFTEVFNKISIIIKCLLLLLIIEFTLINKLKVCIFKKIIIIIIIIIIFVVIVIMYTLSVFNS